MKQTPAWGSRQRLLWRRRASIGWKHVKKAGYSHSCCCIGVKDDSHWKKLVIPGRLLLGPTIGQVSTSHVWRVPKFFNWKYKHPKKLKQLVENWRHILYCHLTTGIRQEICSRILYVMHGREHVAAPLSSRGLVIYFILGPVYVDHCKYNLYEICRATKMSARPTARSAPVLLAPLQLPFLWTISTVDVCH